MSKFKMLNLALSGRSAKSTNVSVNGDTIIFGKTLAKQMNIGDNVSLGIGGADGNRCYILPADPDATAYPVNGKDGTRRYLRNSAVVKALRLENGDYPVIKDADGWYIEFNPNAPEPTSLAKRETKKRTPKEDAENKAENKKVAEEIKNKRKLA